MESVVVEINDFSSLGLKFGLSNEGCLPRVTQVFDNSQCKGRVHLDDELLLVDGKNLKDDGKVDKFKSIIKKQMDAKKPFHLSFLRKKTEAQQLQADESCEEKTEEVNQEIKESEVQESREGKKEVVAQANGQHQVPPLDLDTALNAEISFNEEKKEEEGQANKGSCETWRQMSNLSNADDASDVQGM